MKIEIDDLTHPAVHALLQEHLDNMNALSPADQVFARDLARLKVPGITVWTAWEGRQLLGCGALKELTARHGEIKSMRTPEAARRRGAGRAILQTIIDEAGLRGYGQLSLETGSHPDFEKAHALYRSAGFAHCGPFGGYVENPHSVFMSLRLSGAA